MLVFYKCTNYQKNESHLDTSLSTEKRVEILLSQMTLEEKVAQVCAQSIRRNSANNEGFSENNRALYKSISNGIGQLENTFDRSKPAQSAEYSNTFQQFLLDSTRLKIPALIGSECLHGHSGYNSTIFPAPIAMACSWNPKLVNKVFDIVGKEARMRGCTEAHTPVLDLGRDPRWGRIEETYGEDTYLVSQIGYAAITGLQGGNTGEPGLTHIIASPKHFAGYGQVAGGRNFAPTAMSTRALYDEILPPFEVAIKKANALGIMVSHCDIDGIPAHGNKWLLTNLLKNKWDFKGMVVSDYMDIQRLNIFYHVVGSTYDAAKMALIAGVDLDLPIGVAYKYLNEVITNEPQLEQYLNESVRRVLTLKFKLGLFENPFTDPDACEKFVGTQVNIAVAQDISNESIVLLKNQDNLLPIDLEKIKSIAIIGPNADSKETGVYSVGNDYVISILEGITEAASPDVKINYTEGCKIAGYISGGNDPSLVSKFPLSEEERNISEAVKLAQTSDVAVVCVGGSTRTSHEATFRKHDKGDRSTLNLFGNQEELVTRLIATGKPVIVVLMGGKPYALPQIAENADAILSTFYLGQQTGIAVSNVLFGKVNPSGKLSISFPRSVGQLPVNYSQKSNAFYKDYLDESSQSLYPFGYGLSYTTFEFSDFIAIEDTISETEEYTFSLKVKNTGSYKGAEVVQVYLYDKVASITRAARLLVRFKKVFLEPGEEKTVQFVLNPQNDLSFTGMNYEKTIESGEFVIQIGNSSENLQLTKSFFIQLKKEKYN